MKRLIPLFAAIVLVVALVFVMRNLEKAAPPEHDEDETPAAQTTPKQTPPSASPGATGEMVDLLPESITGVADPKYRITVGWYFDETNQPDPKALQDALLAVKQIVETSAGKANVLFVNVDVPREDRSPEAQTVSEPGIAVNGVMRPDMAGNPGEGSLTADRLGHLVPMLLQGP